jgi:oxalate decarboxylase/phosphoglucose isomerase-like protein (cupin superfamily)
MKKIAIQNLASGLVKGIKVQLPSDRAGHRETYFEWTPSSLIATFKKTEISCGMLRAWHHTPVFHEIETHVDAEMFYFLSGVALMLLVEVKDEQADLNSARIVRIQPRTQLVIEAGKGHFVAVAESEEPVCMLVVSPQMEAPRIILSEEVEGIGNGSVIL